MANSIRVLDGICRRAERGEIALTEEEFEALQGVVVAHERGFVSHAQYAAMVAARDHCKQQTSDAHTQIQRLKRAVSRLEGQS